MADDELVRLLASDPSNPILKQRSSQMWGGLRSYLPEQPEIMKSAQGALAKGLGSLPPEALLALTFASRSSVGAAIGRDNVMARRLENRARSQDGTFDHGITGGVPNVPREGSKMYYDPVARSSTGLMHEPGMKISGEIPWQYRLPMRDASRIPQPANSRSPFDVISGGKK